MCPEPQLTLTQTIIAKATAALALLREGCEFVLIHVEGINEVSHDEDITAKIKAIEDSSEILIRHLVETVPEDVILCVLSDHTTSCFLGDHTPDPTGILFWSKGPGMERDQATKFWENEFSKGALVKTAEKHVMPLLMGFMGRLKKLGA
jgi:2,3-bisphosphoglycerate-independent phosphoglycerate mutase